MAARHYPELVERFWSRVVIAPGADPCWLWTGSVSDSGYGNIKARGETLAAHRLSLAMALGRPLRSDEAALHRCDTPTCVRPAHLEAGTQLENIRQMHERGRARPWGHNTSLT